MKKIIDFLAEQEKQAKTRQDATKTRKAGKHGRLKQLMRSLANVQTPLPVLDFLGD